MGRYGTVLSEVKYCRIFLQQSARRASSAHGESVWFQSVNTVKSSWSVYGSQRVFLFLKTRVIGLYQVLWHSLVKISQFNGTAVQFQPCTVYSPVTWADPKLSYIIKKWLSVGMTILGRWHMSQASVPSGENSQKDWVAFAVAKSVQITQKSNHLILKAHAKGEMHR